MFKKMIALLLAGSMLLGMGCAVAEESVFTDEMVQRSLVSVGNTERIHKAIAKAQSGETVTLAYLGGSITEGAQAQPQKTACYAYLSAQLFAEKFAKDPEQINYVNAGISGTPSLLGITRVEQDVLSKQPDVVFVEFAVNDSSDEQARIVYESLVRRLLNSETQPAVVLIFTVLAGGYTAQPHMQAVGTHYNLGMISVKNAMFPEITAGNMTFDDYSADKVHPNTAGHAFIADMLGYYFDQAAATEAVPYQMPEGVKYGAAYENLKNIRRDSANIISVGSFKQGVYPCYTYLHGWQNSALTAIKGMKPLVLTLTCSRLTIAWKQETDTKCGKAEVVVDGKVMQTINAYDASAWGNVATVAINLGESAAHTVEIRMAEGDEKKTFTLLDIGYVK